MSEISHLYLCNFFFELFSSEIPVTSAGGRSIPAILVDMSVCSVGEWGLRRLDIWHGTSDIIPACCRTPLLFDPHVPNDGHCLSRPQNLRLLWRHVDVCLLMPDLHPRQRSSFCVSWGRISVGTGGFSNLAKWCFLNWIFGNISIFSGVRSFNKNR